MPSFVFRDFPLIHSIPQVHQSHDIDLENGLFGHSLGGKQQDDMEAPPSSKISAALEKCKLEVASLAEKLSSSLKALEAKNAELRESQSDKESLKAKLDEEKDARMMAEKRLAEKDPNDAGRIGERNAEPAPSAAKPMWINKIAAKGLDEAVEDADGVKTFSQVTRSFSVTLHAELEVVLESILGR